MVALRWCEEDREEQQQELVGRLTVAGGSPSGREPRRLQLAPREVPYPGGRAGPRWSGEGRGPSFGAV